MPLLQTLLASGVLGAPAATGGPVNNNPRVEFKVKFNPQGSVDDFLGDSTYVKYITKKAVTNLLETNSIDESLYPSDKVKVLWDHGSVDGDYYNAYVYFQFKYGEDEAAEEFYDAVKAYDNSGADGSTAKNTVKDYIKSKLNPGYDKTDQTTCESASGPSHTWLAAGTATCGGYYSCLSKNAVDNGGVDCTSYDYDQEGHFCSIVTLDGPECEVDGSSLSTATTCRDEYGTFWKSSDAMTCTGYGSYEDAYVCNNLDITKCWGSTDCSYCTDLVYYTSSDPVKACTFNAEDESSGTCLTGFCRNDNCYVKELYVTLANVEDNEFVTGHWIAVAYVAVALLTIVTIHVCPTCGDQAQTESKTGH